MSKTTIWGPLLKLGDIGAKYDRYGLREAWAIDELLPEIPDNFRVTIDHDHEVGRLAHVEIGDDRVVRAVAIVDGDISSYPGNLYFSGEFVTFDGGHDRICSAHTAALSGLSIVPSAASLYVRAHPLQTREGSVLDGETGSWPYGWQTRTPILGRAFEHRSRTPTRIVGPSPQLSSIRTDYGSIAHFHGDELVAVTPGELEHRRPRGRLEYGPRGRVLSVR